jgi:hypothetical protein
VAWADVKDGGDLLDVLRPPFFVTGDPRREWQFIFLLTLPLYGPKDGILRIGGTVVSAVVGSMALAYVSGLAEKVTIPSSKFSLELTPFSNLQAYYPKGVETPYIQVQYLEDDLGLVSLFHRFWQSSVIGYLKGAGSSHGVVFEELGKVAATAVYSPSRKMPLAGRHWDVPMGLDVWPAVFPVEVASDPANKGGNNLSKVSVTYARIPVWSMSENIYEWTPADEAKAVTVPGNWSGSMFGG